MRLGKRERAQLRIDKFMAHQSRLRSEACPHVDGNYASVWRKDGLREPVGLAKVDWSYQGKLTFRKGHSVL